MGHIHHITCHMHHMSHASMHHVLHTSHASRVMCHMHHMSRYHMRHVSWCHDNMRHVVTCVTYHSVTCHMRHVSRCHMSRCHGRVQWSQGGVKQCRVWWRLECKTCSKFKTSVNSVLGSRHAVSYSWRLHTNADFTVKCQLHSSTRSVQQHSDCTAQELHSLIATAQPYSDCTTT